MRRSLSDERGEARVPQTPSLESFEAVYAAHADRIYRYCFRLCNLDADSAADVAQETWLRVHDSLKKGATIVSIEAWLYTIARNEWVRSRKRMKTIPMSQVPGSEEIAAEPATQQINHLAIQQCLERLAQPLREALVLVKMEGFSHREAAAILRRPQGTVQYQVNEALKRLRRDLVEDGLMDSIAPLAILETELGRWGDQKAPPSLWGVLHHALTSFPEGRNGVRSQGAGGRAARWLGADATLNLRSWTGMALATSVLVASLFVFRSNTRTVPKNLPLPARLVENARSIKRVRASGVQTVFADAGPQGVQKRQTTVTYWFEAPDRLRIDIAPVPGSTSTAPSSYVALGARTSYIQWDRKNRPTVLWNVKVTPVGMTPIGFMDPSSPLSKALIDASHPKTLAATEPTNGATRLISVNLESQSDTTHWDMYADPLTAQARRVDCTHFQVKGQRRDPHLEILITQIEYDVPIPAGTFHIPDKP